MHTLALFIWTAGDVFGIAIFALAFVIMCVYGVLLLIGAAFNSVRNSIRKFRKSRRHKNAVREYRHRNDRA